MQILLVGNIINWIWILQKPETFQKNTPDNWRWKKEPYDDNGVWDYGDNGARNTESILNSSPPGQNGCHFADDAFRCIFLNDGTKPLL